MGGRYHKNLCGVKNLTGVSGTPKGGYFSEGGGVGVCIFTVEEKLFCMGALRFGLKRVV